MILDLERFVAQERGHWVRLEAALDRLEREPSRRLDLDGVREVHLLFQRATSDLARLRTFSADFETRRYLEALVARAYGEVHEARGSSPPLRHLGRALLGWFTRGFPRAVRRHAAALGLAVAVTLGGSCLGGLALVVDPEAKEALVPFSHLRGSPTERVAREESGREDRLRGHRATFSAELMTHNIRVSILALALGATWGLGTVVLLFHNGVLLGAVAVDYVTAGQSAFLAGWLLPHGAVEIPAVLLAGQGGLVLAGALIGWGDTTPLRGRLRRVAPDVVSLMGGVACLLVWAGGVESFFSQYHEPVLPYGLKIAFGTLELLLLGAFLGRAGRGDS